MGSGKNPPNRLTALGIPAEGFFGKLLKNFQTPSGFRIGSDDFVDIKGHAIFPFF